MSHERSTDPTICVKPGPATAFFAGALLTLLAAGSAHAHPGDAIKKDALRALGKSLPVELIDEASQDDWVWAELNVNDGEFPLTVDVLVNRHGLPSRVVYLLPASGTNFSSTFFSGETSLAHFFRQHDYLVIGITPREDHVAAGQAGPAMGSWGIAQHREDVRKVVGALEPILPLPADMLGYSFSAGTALDYAAHYSGRLDRVMVLDLYSLNPADAEALDGATRLNAGLNQLIGEGHVMDMSLADAKQLFIGANLYPAADSGVSRSFLGLPGNFTTAGMLHFLLIYSALLPGEHTPYTGLMRDWPLVLSSCAGYYAPAPDPQQDAFAMYHTEASRFLDAGLKMGSGAIPYALMRDWVSTTLEGGYEIPWGGIDEAVVWVNAELGYGSQTHAADLIRATGNQSVSVSVVPGYGNIDPLVSHTAAEDVWALFLP